jgi:hypothetical protein
MVRIPSIRDNPVFKEILEEFDLHRNISGKQVPDPALGIDKAAEEKQGSSSSYTDAAIADHLANVSETATQSDTQAFENSVRAMTDPDAVVKVLLDSVPAGKRGVPDEGLVNGNDDFRQLNIFLAKWKMDDENHKPSTHLQLGLLLENIDKLNHDSSSEAYRKYSLALDMLLAGPEMTSARNVNLQTIWAQINEPFIPINKERLTKAPEYCGQLYNLGLQLAKDHPRAPNDQLDSSERFEIFDRDELHRILKEIESLREDPDSKINGKLTESLLKLDTFIASQPANKRRLQLQADLTFVPKEHSDLSSPARSGKRKRDNSGSEFENQAPEPKKKKPESSSHFITDSKTEHDNQAEETKINEERSTESSSRPVITPRSLAKQNLNQRPHPRGRPDTSNLLQYALISSLVQRRDGI